MNMRLAPERDYLRLKAAWRLLLNVAGGGKHVIEEKITRGSESRLSEAGAPNCMDRFPFLDQIFDLELDTGNPVVTKALADLHGYDLVQREAGQPLGIHAHFSRIVREAAELQTRMADAMADEKLTDAEKAELIKELDELIAVAQAARAEWANKCQKVTGR